MEEHTNPLIVFTCFQAKWKSAWKYIDSRHLVPATHLLLGVSLQPGVDQAQEGAGLNQRREDQEDQVGGPGAGAGDGDEVCGSDLEEKDQHSEILNTVHTQMLSSI